MAEEQTLYDALMKCLSAHEFVEGVVFGDRYLSGYRAKHGIYQLIPQDKLNTVLSINEAAPYLKAFTSHDNYEICEDMQRVEYTIILWTNKRVIFYTESHYECDFVWVPRNPVSYEPPPYGLLLGNTHNASILEATK